MRYAHWLVVAASSIVACEVVVTEVPSGDGEIGVVGSPPADPFVCAAWEERDLSDVENLVRGVAETLEQEGQPMDAAAWGDPERFGDVMSRVYERAGCPIPLVDKTRPPEPTDSSHFCGSGHGPPSLFRPPVDPCLNSVCRSHDACYAMCDQHIPWGCQWSSTTTGCDDPFIDAARRCELVDHRFASKVVIAIATLLNGFAKAGCGAATCPDFGELGRGPCGDDLESETCLQCLGAVDREGCHSSCSDDAEPAICTAAVCESTAQCFGGYGYGADDVSADGVPIEAVDGGALDAGTFPLPAADAEWHLILVDVTVPSSKPNGAAWDVGADHGFGPPDPRVVVTLSVGNESVGSFRSSIAQDSFEAQWNESLLSGQTAVLAAATARVIDADFIVDDVVGDCRLPSHVLARFGTGPFAMGCDVEGLAVRLEFASTDF